MQRRILVEIYRRSFQKKHIVPSICRVLVTVFLFDNVCFAHKPTENLWDQRRAQQNTQLAALTPTMPRFPSAISRSQVQQALRSLPAASASLSANKRSALSKINLELPNNLLSHVNVREAFRGSSNYSVMLLEDVHANQEAQQQLSAALQSIANENRPVRVGLEGADGKMLFDVYRQFSDQQVAKEVADAFFASNELSGPAHAGFTVDKGLEFYGADNEQLYSMNVNAYKRASKIKKETEATLAKLMAANESAKRETFSAALKSFDGKVRDYREGKLALAEYLKTLAALGGKTSINVDTFLQAYEMETSLNLDDVNREREIVLSKLVTTLKEKDLQSLLDLSVAYKEGQLTFAQYYDALRATCEKHDIDLSKTPSFNRYIQYVLLADGINTGSLLTEITDLEKQVYESLATTAAEKYLIAKSRRLYLSHELINFALTPEQWREYTARGRVGEGARGKNDQYFRRPGNLQAGISLPAHELIERDEFSSALRNFELFYQAADARSAAMVSHLTTAVSPPRPLSPSPTLSILVAGGFHTAEVSKLLRQKNITYLVASPKITKLGDESPSAYLSVFDREKTPLDQMFAGKKLFLADCPGGSPMSPTTGSLAQLANAEIAAKLGHPDQSNNRVAANLNADAAVVAVESSDGQTIVDAITPQGKRLRTIFSSAAQRAKLGFSRWFWKQYDTHVIGTVEALRALPRWQVISGLSFAAVAGVGLGFLAHALPAYAVVPAAFLAGITSSKGSDRISQATRPFTQRVIDPLYVYPIGFGVQPPGTRYMMHQLLDRVRAVLETLNGNELGWKIKKLERVDTDYRFHIYPEQAEERGTVQASDGEYSLRIAPDFVWMKRISVFVEGPNKKTADEILSNIMSPLEQIGIVVSAEDAAKAEKRIKEAEEFRSWAGTGLWLALGFFTLSLLPFASTTASGPLLATIVPKISTILIAGLIGFFLVAAVSDGGSLSGSINGTASRALSSQTLRTLRAQAFPGWLPNFLRMAPTTKLSLINQEILRALAPFQTETLAGREWWLEDLGIDPYGHVNAKVVTKDGATSTLWVGTGATETRLNILNANSVPAMENKVVDELMAHFEKIGLVASASASEKIFSQEARRFTRSASDMTFLGFISAGLIYFLAHSSSRAGGPLFAAIVPQFPALMVGAALALVGLAVFLIFRRTNSDFDHYSSVHGLLTSTEDKENPRTFAASFQDGTVLLFDARGQYLAELYNGAEWFSNLLLSHDRTRLIGASETSIHQWKLSPKLESLPTLMGLQGRIRNMTMNAEFVAANDGRQIVIWNSKTGTPVARVEEDATRKITALQFAGSHTLLITFGGASQTWTFGVTENADNKNLESPFWKTARPWNAYTALILLGGLISIVASSNFQASGPMFATIVPGIPVALSMLLGLHFLQAIVPKNSKAVRVEAEPKLFNGIKYNDKEILAVATPTGGSFSALEFYAWHGRRTLYDTVSMKPLVGLVKELKVAKILKRVDHNEEVVLLLLDQANEGIASVRLGFGKSGRLRIEAIAANKLLADLVSRSFTEMLAKKGWMRNPSGVSVFHTEDPNESESKWETFRLNPFQAYAAGKTSAAALSEMLTARRVGSLLTITIILLLTQTSVEATTGSLFAMMNVNPEYSQLAWLGAAAALGLVRKIYPREDAGTVIVDDVEVFVASYDAMWNHLRDNAVAHNALDQFRMRFPTTENQFLPVYFQREGTSVIVRSGQQTCRLDLRLDNRGLLTIMAKKVPTVDRVFARMAIDGLLRRLSDHFVTKDYVEVQWVSSVPKNLNSDDQADAGIVHAKISNAPGNHYVAATLAAELPASGKWIEIDGKQWFITEKTDTREKVRISLFSVSGDATVFLSFNDLANVLTIEVATDKGDKSAIAKYFFRYFENKGIVESQSTNAVRFSKDAPPNLKSGSATAKLMAFGLLFLLSALPAMAGDFSSSASLFGALDPQELTGVPHLVWAGLSALAAGKLLVRKFFTHDGEVRLEPIPLKKTFFVNHPNPHELNERIWNCIFDEEKTHWDFVTNDTKPLFNSGYLPCPRNNNFELGNVRFEFADSAHIWAELGQSVLAIQFEVSAGQLTLSGKLQRGPALNSKLIAAVLATVVHRLNDVGGTEKYVVHEQPIVSRAQVSEIASEIRSFSPQLKSLLEKEDNNGKSQQLIGEVQHALKLFENRHHEWALVRTDETGVGIIKGKSGEYRLWITADADEHTMEVKVAGSNSEERQEILRDILEQFEAYGLVTSETVVKTESTRVYPGINNTLNGLGLWLALGFFTLSLLPFMSTDSSGPLLAMIDPTVPGLLWTGLSAAALAQIIRIKPERTSQQIIIPGIPTVKWHPAKHPYSKSEYDDLWDLIVNRFDAGVEDPDEGLSSRGSYIPREDNFKVKLPFGPHGEIVPVTFYRAASEAVGVETENEKFVFAVNLNADETITIVADGVTDTNQVQFRMAIEAFLRRLSDAGVAKQVVALEWNSPASESPVGVASDIVRAPISKSLKLEVEQSTSDHGAAYIMKKLINRLPSSRDPFTVDGQKWEVERGTDWPLHFGLAMKGVPEGQALVFFEYDPAAQEIVIDASRVTPESAKVSFANYFTQLFSAFDIVDGQKARAEKKAIEPADSMKWRSPRAHAAYGWLAALLLLALAPSAMAGDFSSTTSLLAMIAPSVPQLVWTGLSAAAAARILKLQPDVKGNRLAMYRIPVWGSSFKRFWQGNRKKYRFFRLLLPVGWWEGELEPVSYRRKSNGMTAETKDQAAQFDFELYQRNEGHDVALFSTVLEKMVLEKDRQFALVAIDGLLRHMADLGVTRGLVQGDWSEVAFSPKDEKTIKAEGEKQLDLQEKIAFESRLRQAQQQTQRQGEARAQKLTGGSKYLIPSIAFLLLSASSAFAGDFSSNSSLFAMMDPEFPRLVWAGLSAAALLKIFKTKSMEEKGTLTVSSIPVRTLDLADFWYALANGHHQDLGNYEFNLMLPVGPNGELERVRYGRNESGLYAAKKNSESIRLILDLNLESEQGFLTASTQVSEGNRAFAKIVIDGLLRHMADVGITENLVQVDWAVPAKPAGLSVPGIVRVKLSDAHAELVGSETSGFSRSRLVVESLVTLLPQAGSRLEISGKQWVMKGRRADLTQYFKVDLSGADNRAATIYLMFSRLKNEVTIDATSAPEEDKAAIAEFFLQRFVSAGIVDPAKPITINFSTELPESLHPSSTSARLIGFGLLLLQATLPAMAGDYSSTVAPMASILPISSLLYISGLLVAFGIVRKGKSGKAKPKEKMEVAEEQVTFRQLISFLPASGWKIFTRPSLRETKFSPIDFEKSKQDGKSETQLLAQLGSTIRMFFPRDFVTIKGRGTIRPSFDVMLSPNTLMIGFSPYTDDAVLIEISFDGLKDPSFVVTAHNQWLATKYTNTVVESLVNAGYGSRRSVTPKFWNVNREEVEVRLAKIAGFEPSLLYKAMAALSLIVGGIFYLSSASMNSSSPMLATIVPGIPTLLAFLLGFNFYRMALSKSGGFGRSRRKNEGTHYSDLIFHVSQKGMLDLSGKFIGDQLADFLRKFEFEREWSMFRLSTVRVTSNVHRADVTLIDADGRGVASAKVQLLRGNHILIHAVSARQASSDRVALDIAHAMGREGWVSPKSEHFVGKGSIPGNYASDNYSVNDALGVIAAALLLSIIPSHFWHVFFYGAAHAAPLAMAAFPIVVWKDLSKNAEEQLHRPVVSHNNDVLEVELSSKVSDLLSLWDKLMMKQSFLSMDLPIGHGGQFIETRLLLSDPLIEPIVDQIHLKSGFGFEIWFALERGRLTVELRKVNEVNLKEAHAVLDQLVSHLTIKGIAKSPVQLDWREVDEELGKVWGLRRAKLTRTIMASVGSHPNHVLGILASAVRDFDRVEMPTHRSWEVRSRQLIQNEKVVIVLKSTRGDLAEICVSFDKRQSEVTIKAKVTVDAAQDDVVSRDEDALANYYAELFSVAALIEDGHSQHSKPHRVGHLIPALGPSVDLFPWIATLIGVGSLSTFAAEHQTSATLALVHSHYSLMALSVVSVLALLFVGGYQLAWEFHQAVIRSYLKTTYWINGIRSSVKEAPQTDFREAVESFSTMHDERVWPTDMRRHAAISIANVERSLNLKTMMETAEPEAMLAFLRSNQLKTAGQAGLLQVAKMPSEQWSLRRRALLYLAAGLAVLQSARNVFANFALALESAENSTNRRVVMIDVYQESDLNRIGPAVSRAHANHDRFVDTALVVVVHDDEDFERLAKRAIARANGIAMAVMQASSFKTGDSLIERRKILESAKTEIGSRSQAIGSLLNVGSMMTTAEAQHAQLLLVSDHPESFAPDWQLDSVTSIVTYLAGLWITYGPDYLNKILETAKIAEQQA